MSILNVDKIQPIGGGSTITVDATDIQATSATITASKFVGSGDLSVTGVSTFTGDLKIGTGITCHASSGIVTASEFATGPVSLINSNTGGRVKTTEGWLTLQGTLGTVIEHTDGTNHIKATHNGAAELYHAGNSKLVTSSSGISVTGVVNATSFTGGLPITNGADNRVITASSASAIQGESNLTFDGTQLVVQGGSGTQHMFRHSAGWGGVTSAGSAGGSGAGFSLANNYNGTLETKWSIYLDGSNDGLRFTANTPDQTSDERLRITSSGSVGINTTLTQSGGGNIMVNIAASSQAFSGSTNLADGGGLMFQPTDTLPSTGRSYPGIFWSGNTAALGRIRAGILGVAASNNDATDLVFLTRYAADGTGLTPADEKLRIDSSGRTLLNNLGNATPGLSGNADDLVIGYGTQSAETGITMYSTTASSIRFNDNSGTDGAIEYGHASRQMSFNAAGANRLIFGINAANSPVFNMGVSSGDANNHNKADRTSVKVGDYLYIESARGAGHNTRAGLGYNCYFHSLDDFYCGTNSPNSGDNRPAAYGMAYGNHYFYSDASNTAHSAQAQLTMTKNMVIHRQGYVTKPQQPSCTLFEPHAIQINVANENVPIGYQHVEHNAGMTVSNGGSSDSTRANSRIQVPVAGRYLISSLMSGSLNSAAAVDANDGVIWYLRKNGSDVNTNYQGMWSWDTLGSTTGQEFDMNFCVVLSLAANDYLEVAYCNIHTNFNIDLNKGYFSVHLLS